MLRRYLALLAALAILEAATPTGSNAVQPSVNSPIITFSTAFRQHVIFVIGTDGDPGTRNKVAASLVERLKLYSIEDNAVLLPEPSWTIADYVNQCAADPAHTDGAFVIEVTATAITSKDKFLYRRTKTEIAGSVLYAQCFPPPLGLARPGSPANVAGNTSYTWASGVEDGVYYQNTLTLLPALATVLTIGAAYMTFVPSKTATNASTTVYPVHSPIPAAGTQSQSVATNQSQTNVAALGSIATAFLAQSVSYTGQTASLPTADEETWNAVEALVSDLVGKMNCAPLIPGASSSGTAAPFCGSALP